LERGERSPDTAGELNYCITVLCDEFIAQHRVNYDLLNSVVGVLESAKLEFYRRLVSFYEDAKCDANGDVYSDEALQACHVGEI
jgi:hypothetical protein